MKKIIFLFICVFFFAPAINAANKADPAAKEKMYNACVERQVKSGKPDDTSQKYCKCYVDYITEKYTIKQMNTRGEEVVIDGMKHCGNY
jgi:hypothetical protein